ncbi:MAG: Na+/H+ antiporter NhaC family protein [Christensenellaceae bacterium]|nr:Na+/H+ antiporter NhaC family protein [Christensenellaceae bacterium]
MSNEAKNTKKLGGLSLIPFLVFIVLLLGSGIIYSIQGVDRPFYQIPAGASLFIAVVVAFIMYKGTFEEKADSFIKGASDENITIMVMTCFLAGSFAFVAKAIGGVESVVNLGLAIVPPQYITVGMFLIACFMSLATGSSSGTTAALGSIAFSIGQGAGLNMPMLLAAVLGGAFFGDNLSIISDTTIVATRTQGVEMKDKFRMNLLISLPAAIITALLYFIFGKPTQEVIIEQKAYDFILILPYLYVLVSAILGMNVFAVLGSGTVIAALVGLFKGTITIAGSMQAIMDGFADMSGIVVLAIFIGGLSQMMTDQGGLDFLMTKIRGIMKDRKSTEVGIAVMVSAADAAVANNTAALIITADVCREVSHENKVDPRRTASLMDIFCCVMQGFLPYGNQILLIGGLAMGTVAPIEMIPYMWYNVLLGFFAILSIFVPFADGVIRKRPWNWETMKPEEAK